MGSRADVGLGFCRRSADSLQTSVPCDSACPRAHDTCSYGNIQQFIIMRTINARGMYQVDFILFVFNSTYVTS